MELNLYKERLEKLKEHFCNYAINLKEIINNLKKNISYTVITKGEIINEMPYYQERIGDKITGKVIAEEIESDGCIKYHYDDKDRLIMTEEYCEFLRIFEIRDIYIYGQNTHKLLISAGSLSRLLEFDNAFSAVSLCLAYSKDYGTCVEEYKYDCDVLNEIDIIKESEDSEIRKYKEIFLYKDGRMVQIRRIFEDGRNFVIYTSLKPDFKSIKEKMRNFIMDNILQENNEFKCFGIESFIKGTIPYIDIYVSNNDDNSNIISEWDTDCKRINIYDWQFNESQERKCIKILSELITELFAENVLNNKKVFFHQDNKCISDIYSIAKNVFKKAGIMNIIK